MGAGASTTNMCLTECAGAPTASRLDAKFIRACWFCDQLHSDETDGSSGSSSEISYCHDCRVRLGITLFSQKKLTSRKNCEEQLFRKLQLSNYMIAAGLSHTCDEFEPSLCDICNNDLLEKEYSIELSCGHVFHRSCICPWFEHHSSCPNCHYDTINHREKIGQLVSENTEEQLQQKVETLHRLAATVSEIGNLDSSDFFMSHQICRNETSSKRDLAIKLEALLSQYSICGNHSYL